MQFVWRDTDQVSKSRVDTCSMQFVSQGGSLAITLALYVGSKSPAPPARLFCDFFKFFLAFLRGDLTL